MVFVVRNIIIRFTRQADYVWFDVDYFKVSNSYNFSLLSDPLGDFDYESVKFYRFLGEPSIKIKIAFETNDDDWITFLKTKIVKRKIKNIVKKYIENQHIRNAKVEVN